MLIFPHHWCEYHSSRRPLQTDCSFTAVWHVSRRGGSDLHGLKHKAADLQHMGVSRSLTSQTVCLDCVCGGDSLPGSDVLWIRITSQSLYEPGTHGGSIIRSIQLTDRYKIKLIWLSQPISVWNDPPPLCVTLHVDTAVPSQTHSSTAHLQLTDWQVWIAEIISHHLGRVQRHVNDVTWGLTQMQAQRGVLFLLLFGEYENVVNDQHSDPTLEHTEFQYVYPIQRWIDKL